jgi:hypothetical protein
VAVASPAECGDGGLSTRGTQKQQAHVTMPHMYFALIRAVLEGPRSLCRPSCTRLLTAMVAAFSRLDRDTPRIYGHARMSLQNPQAHLAELQAGSTGLSPYETRTRDVYSSGHHNTRDLPGGAFHVIQAHIAHLLSRKCVNRVFAVAHQGMYGLSPLHL